MMQADGKKNFLVVYDYGMGGLWGVISARSAAEITQAYPELTVFLSQPSFMPQSHYDELKSGAVTMDIDGEPEDILRIILHARQKP